MFLNMEYSLNKSTYEEITIIKCRSLYKLYEAKQSLFFLLLMASNKKVDRVYSPSTFLHLIFSPIYVILSDTFS